MTNLPVLIYDGHCNFCRRQASRVSALSGGRLKLESFHDAGVLERYPGLTHEACEEAMQLVLPDGRIFAGAAAAAEAFRLNPAFGGLGVLYYLPGVRQLSDAVYRWVARNRFRFGGRCTDGACAHR
jgi:predicted DCC family thiol-disulfide oxidoreductase YuxK